MIRQRWSTERRRASTTTDDRRRPRLVRLLLMLLAVTLLLKMHEPVIATSPELWVPIDVPPGTVG